MFFSQCIALVVAILTAPGCQTIGAKPDGSSHSIIIHGSDARTPPGQRAWYYPEVSDNAVPAKDEDWTYKLLLDAYRSLSGKKYRMQQVSSPDGVVTAVIRKGTIDVHFANGATYKGLCPYVNCPVLALYGVKSELAERVATAQAAAVVFKMANGEMRMYYVDSAGWHRPIDETPILH